MARPRHYWDDDPSLYGSYAFHLGLEESLQAWALCGETNRTRTEGVKALRRRMHENTGEEGGVGVGWGGVGWGEVGWGGVWVGWGEVGLGEMSISAGWGWGVVQGRAGRVGQSRVSGAEQLGRAGQGKRGRRVGQGGAGRRGVKNWGLDD